MNESSRRVVLFDLYHTLVDIDIDESSDEFWQKIEDYLSNYGSRLNSDSLKEIYIEMDRQIKLDQLKGQSVLETSIPRYLRVVTGQTPNIGQLYEFVAVFRKSSIKTLKVRDFVSPLINRLSRHGYVCGIVSNTEALFTKIDLENLGIANKFKTIVLSSDVGAEKPDFKPFSVALDNLGATAEQTIFIGDNLDADIIGADKVGMRSILLSDDYDEFIDRIPLSCLDIVPSTGKGLFKKIAYALHNSKMTS